MHRWRVSTWEGAPRYLVREMQITTRHHSTPSRMPQILEQWQPQRPVEMWSTRHSPSLLVGRQKGPAATLQDRLAVSCKAKGNFATRSNRWVPWYFPKGVKNLHLPDKTYIWMFIGLSIIAKNLEGTKMSSSRWMDKLRGFQTMAGWPVKLWKDLRERYMHKTK